MGSQAGPVEAMVAQAAPLEAKLAQAMPLEAMVATVGAVQSSHSWYRTRTSATRSRGRRRTCCCSKEPSASLGKEKGIFWYEGRTELSVHTLKVTTRKRLCPLDHAIWL